MHTVNMAVDVEKVHPFLAAVAADRTGKEVIGSSDLESNEVVFHGSLLVCIEPNCRFIVLNWLHVLSMLPYCFIYTQQSRV